MRLRATLLALVLGAITPRPALADVLIWIDLSEQYMKVAHDGVGLYRWPVSTARAGKCTPTGTFRPQFLDPDHRSALYDNAPMPWSIFFNGHIAIHGTDQIENLGTPASAGCVRLHPDNAKLLYEMVKAEGLEHTLVVVAE